MTFDISMSDEDRRLLIETVRALVAAKIEPSSKAIDGEGAIPAEIYNSLTAAGLHAANVAGTYGGGGASITDCAVIIEEVAKGSAAVASLLVMNTAGVAGISASSNEHLKSDLLSRVARGEVILSWSADSIENQAGVIASLNSEGITINGKIHWIPFYEVGAAPVVLAEVKAQAGSHLLAVELEAPRKGRAEVGPLESDLGLRGASLRPLSFDNLLVGDDWVIGSSMGQGAASLALHSAAQVGIAALANGIAAAALDHAWLYARERHQFGVAISEFESTRTILGTMALNLEASRNLTFAAAAHIDQGSPISRNGIPIESAAKWLAAKSAVEIAIDAIQIFGGYGFVKDYPVERFMRDAKITQLMGGTGQILEIADAMAGA